MLERRRGDVVGQFRRSRTTLCESMNTWTVSPEQHCEGFVVAVEGTRNERSVIGSARRHIRDS